MVYHIEVFCYSIVDGNLVKFLKIKSLSDIMIDCTFYFYERESDSAPEVYLDAVFLSYNHGMPHDEALLFRKSSEIPYIKISKDSLYNYKILRLGPYYKERD
ncbi:MAG: hypothetical protein K6D58_07260 [Treponema sp.]|nr:hypothetical protein [Treponema sp.]